MTAKNSTLTQARLKELLRYDPETGIFTRIKSISPTARIGDIAGCIDKSTGYLRIRIDYVLYYSHRLAFLYVEGVWPDVHVDHISGIRDDNRWENLRHADDALNSKNMKMSKNNTTGIVGVCLFKPKNCNDLIYFKSRIIVDNAQIYLYDGPDFFEACARRKSAEIKHGFHPNHGRKI